MNTNTTETKRDEFVLSIVILVVSMVLNVVILTVLFALGKLSFVSVIIWYICNSLSISIIYIVAVMIATSKKGGSDGTARK